MSRERSPCDHVGMTSSPPTRVAVIGGGPAGLMAAETARAAGLAVDVFDSMGSVGRKFLVAGKGGLNLTHSESFDGFVHRFRQRAAWVEPWLRAFGPAELRAWARELGVETMIGTSGRVFPSDLKAAPLLRGWVRRLREQDVHFHLRHRWRGWDDSGALRFDTTDGETRVPADATVLALGGASWPELGSDGQWVRTLSQHAIPVVALQPANCGFEVGWSEVFAARHAGAPVKPVRMGFVDVDGHRHEQQGEFVVTAQGIEGSLVYALSAALRETLSARGTVTVQLDLTPDRDAARLQRELATPRGRRTLSEHMRRQCGLAPVAIGLLHEALPRPLTSDPVALAAAIKSLPIVLRATRPIAEAISSAGGVPPEALDASLMLRGRPGVFCAGEMLDWEAPTGGYLLTACFASGHVAGRGAVDWLAARR
jgi:uncharacterized flavoprotein (TIGR03862 family)